MLIKYQQIVVQIDCRIGKWPVEIIADDEMYLFSTSESDCLYFLDSNVIRFEGHATTEMAMFEYSKES